MVKQKPKNRRSSKKPVGNKASPYTVFVSHATVDKWIAKTICEKIESQGAEFFRDDRDIHGGDDIPNAIRKAIVRANELLVLLTPESVDRPWVLVEVGAAWGRKQNARIVAVLCHVEMDTIPSIIASKKAFSINEFDNYLKELRRRVERYQS